MPMKPIWNIVVRMGWMNRTGTYRYTGTFVDKVPVLKNVPVHRTVQSLIKTKVVGLTGLSNWAWLGELACLFTKKWMQVAGTSSYVWLSALWLLYGVAFCTSIALKHEGSRSRHSFFNHLFLQRRFGIPIFRISTMWNFTNQQWQMQFVQLDLFTGVHNWNVHSGTKQRNLIICHCQAIK